MALPCILVTYSSDVQLQVFHGFRAILTDNFGTRQNGSEHIRYILAACRANLFAIMFPSNFLVGTHIMDISLYLASQQFFQIVSNKLGNA